MRILFPPGQRSNWFDRNAASLANTYEAYAVAPHAETTRWTYTVPAGKKFLIGSGAINFQRDAAAAAAAAAGAYIKLTPSGGAATTVLRCMTALSAVGSPQIIAGLQGLILFAADVIDGRTVDSSTGGSFNYAVNLAGAEFDA